MAIFIICLDKGKKKSKKKENIEITIKEKNEHEVVDASADDENPVQQLTQSDITKEFLPKFQVLNFHIIFTIQIYGEYNKGNWLTDKFL